MVNRTTKLILTGGLVALGLAGRAAADGAAVLIELREEDEAIIRCQSGRIEAHAAAEGDLLVHCHRLATPTPVIVPPAPSATRTGAPPATSAPTATHDHGGGATATALPPGAQMPALVDWGAFDARRIPISMEAWWTQASLTPGDPTSQTADFGHVHAEARLPLGQDVSGVLDFDVRVVMHHNPGRMVQLRIDDDGGVVKRIPVGQSCPGGGTCSFNVPVSLDTRTLRNGWREIRIRAETETPDDKQFLNSSGIPLRVVNGSGGSDYNRWCGNKSLIARGWYEGFGYTNSVIECVPLAPVSGIWRPRFYAQDGNGGRVIVAVDKAHPVPAAGAAPAIPAMPGRTYFDAASIGRFHEIAIDTRELADGWHTLSMITINPRGERSICNLPGLCQGGINHPAGVARIWFMVQNGG